MNLNLNEKIFEKEQICENVDIQKKKEKIKTFILGLIYMIFATTLFLLITFYPPVKQALYYAVAYLLELELLGYILIILFGMFIWMSGIPYTIFEIILGFSIENFLIAVGLNMIIMTTASSLQFLIAKKLFREKLKQYFHQNKYYIVLQKLIEGENNQTSKLENQSDNIESNDQKISIEQEQQQKEQQQGSWYNILLINLLYIPQFVQNYGIPLFNVRFHIYILAGLPVYTMYGLLFIYLGLTSRDAKVLFSAYNENVLQKVIFYLTAVCSIIIFIYIFYFTRKTLKRLGASDDELTSNNQQQQSQDDKYHQDQCIIQHSKSDNQYKYYNLA